MLQQTTTTAVIPFFERFIARFPTLHSLADANLEAVYSCWAGLGYYSRARNLHKAAQQMHKQGGIPRQHKELLDFPGFGPYTARSVASLAYDEPVGVVDGNVIRVFSRLYGVGWEWWQGKARTDLQALADEWVQRVSSYEMNQALMELGRTICRPKQPSCLLCPLHKECKALKAATVSQLPLAKPKRKREIWVWQATVRTKGSLIQLVKDESIPFAKTQWILPGSAARVKAKPAQYHYKHTITHHDIYVTVQSGPLPSSSAAAKWVALKEIRQHAPTALVDKALRFYSEPHDRARLPSKRKARATQPARNRQR